MDFVEATSTVFAVLLPRLQFEVSYPVAAGLIATCAAAWILIAVDMRRHRTQVRQTERQPSQPDARPWATATLDSYKQSGE
jgi:hypothetical protein